jgi:hypothetical protein
MKFEPEAVAGDSQKKDPGAPDGQTSHNILMRKRPSQYCILVACPEPLIDGRPAGYPRTEDAVVVSDRWGTLCSVIRRTGAVVARMYVTHAFCRVFAMP